HVGRKVGGVVAAGVGCDGLSLDPIDGNVDGRARVEEDLAPAETGGGQYRAEGPPTALDAEAADHRGSKQRNRFGAHIASAYAHVPLGKVVDRPQRAAMELVRAVAELLARGHVELDHAAAGTARAQQAELVLQHAHERVK